MNSHSLMENIEVVRNHLNILICQETSLTQEQVVKLSQELDELISKYYYNTIN